MNKLQIFKKGHFMSLLWRSVLVLMLCLSFSVSADDALDAPCGMTYNDEGILIVEEFNGEICENDIAMQMLFLFYADILEEGVWSAMISPFLHEEAEDSEFVQFASNTIGISDFVSGLMSIIAIISWTILTFVVGYKSFKVYVLFSAKTGEEEAEDINKPRLIGYFGFLVFLILPVNGIMIGQGLSIVGAFPSLYVSNQLLASYLAGTSIAETDVVVAQDLLETQGQSFSSGLIAMQICQSRTSKALFEANAKKDTAFFDPFGWDRLYTLDQKFTSYEVNACLSYHFEGEYVNESSTDAIRRITLQKGATYLGRCPGAGFRDYVEDVHGFEHLCGEINYSYPGATEDIDNWGLEDSLIAIQKEFTPNTIFGRFKEEELMLEMLMFESIRDPAEIRVETNEIFDNLVAEHLEPKLRESTLFNEQDREKLLVQYMYALNSMLGGSVLDDAEWEVNNEAIQYIIPGLNDDNEGHRYGAEYLTEYAFDIADLLEEFHCAVNWKDYSELRRHIVQYNRSDEDDLEGYLSSSKNSDCLRFVDFTNGGGDPENNDERGRYIGYQTKHDLPVVFADISNEDLVQFKTMTEEEFKETTETLINLVATDRYKEAVVKKVILEGYYTSVKRAFINVLSERLMSEVGSEDMYIIARQKGAAALGAMMTNITQNQASGVFFKSLIQETGTVSAYADSQYYLNVEAFGKKGEKKINDIHDSFSEFETATFFDIGNAALIDPGLSSSVDRERSEFNTLMGNVESFIFEPLIHVKKASGIPSDVQLMEGLEDCMNGDNSRCISSASHPMVAMSRFGHHLADNMITLYITHIVVQMINDRVGLFKVNDDAETKKKEGAMEWGRKIVSKGAFLLTGLISVVAVLLNLLAPLFLVLFAVGIFFAYILPVLGYLYSMSMVFLWVVALGLGAFTMPFYIIVKMLTIERSHKDGFMDFYQTFVNPYVKLLFITLSVVFAYLFMSIALFANNSAFGMLFAGMDSLATTTVNGFSLSKLVFKLLLYVAFFVSVFVLMVMSLKMIKSLSDIMARNMKLNGTNDDNFIDSMQFESYVQANIVQQIAKLPEQAVQGMQRAHGKAASDKLIAANISKIDAFLAKTDSGTPPKTNADENDAQPSSKGVDESDLSLKSDAADESQTERSGRQRRGSDMKQNGDDSPKDSSSSGDTPPSE
jgi:hypothetical protein